MATDRQNGAMHRTSRRHVKNGFRRLRARTLSIVSLGAAAVSLAIPLSSAPSSASSPNAATNWTVYHGVAAGSGLSTALRAVDTAHRAWTSPSLAGELYGEPLVYDGRVFVATEDDLVYALSATNGRVIWARHVASAVPSSKLPCGDIGPTVGITGTPVIDPTRNEIFVVADELVGGGPHHTLVGLSTQSGAVELRERVDPPGAAPDALLQRTGLNLDDGRVIFAMGGNDGDCASYRGRVGSVKETGSTPTFFTVDAAAGESQGAIWMGGAAPEVDKSGNIWVAAGNGSVNSASQPYDDSDSALELSASLRLRQYFAPSSWPQDNASDLDQSTAPALLSDGQVVLAGKSPFVYLLDGAHLGGIGRQVATITGGCGAETDGGDAVVGSTIYLPCLSGPIAVRVGTGSLSVLWRADVGGGPPIVAAGLVWTIGQNGELYGLNASNGNVRQEANVGVPANHFPTPSVGDDLLLVPTNNRVVAFHGSAAP
jgi:outer membrane protein assembly factor BamB